MAGRQGLTGCVQETNKGIKELMIKQKRKLGTTRAALKKYAFTLGSVGVFAVGAHADVLAIFGFETVGTAGTTAASVGGILADSGIGTASSVHASSSTVFSSPAGSGSARSLSANNYAAGDYFQFTLATTGFTAIMLNFDMQRSGTGPTVFDIAYGTNGTNFTTAGSFTLGAGSFSTTATSTTTHYAFDLSTVTALNNIGSAYFRVVSEGINTSGTATPTGGTARIDNFVVSGTAPEPSAIALVSIAGAGMAMAMRRRKKAL